MTVVNEVRADRPVAAATRTILLAVLAAAMLWTLVSAVTAVAALIGDVAHGTVAATLAPHAPVPVQRVGSPLTSAVYDSASVVVTGAPAGVQVLAAAAKTATIATRLLLGVAFVLLIVAVLRRSPFSSRTALHITVCGGIAMISALLAIGLGVLADWMIADFLTTAGTGQWPMAAIFDPAPISIGFALMLVGLLISHGTQLQRATDGLV